MKPAEQPSENIDREIESGEHEGTRSRARLSIDGREAEGDRRENVSCPSEARTDMRVRRKDGSPAVHKARFVHVGGTGNALHIVGIYG